MRRVMEQGDFRPMAHNRDAMNDLVAILDARAPAYGRAHARVDTSGKSVGRVRRELVSVAERCSAEFLVTEVLTLCLWAEVAAGFG